MREHGTYACYVWGPEPGQGKGCRCDACREANRAYERQRARRTAPAYVDAGRARAHVAWLRGQGVGLKTVAKRSGVSGGALSKLVYGDRTRGQAPSKRIRKSTEDAILAVTANDASDGARVPADRFHRDVATLLDRGWTKSEIARRCGQSPQNFGKVFDQVTRAKADAVRALLDEPVPPRRTRWGTKAVGWDPEAERRDAARRAAEAERRAAYRAAQREPESEPADLFAAELGAWRSQAACRRVAAEDLWIFWADEHDRPAIEAAKAVCATCRVDRDCLAAVLASPEVGVWGGTTESERRHLREAVA